MKVIDLLNKIANGEEVPKKIKFEDYIYEYNIKEEDYYNEKYCDGILDSIALFSQLNDEIEILEEEKKIPRKLNYKYKNMYGRVSQHKQSEIDIIDTLNQVIDYLGSKGE